MTTQDTITGGAQGRLPGAVASPAARRPATRRVGNEAAPASGRGLARPTAVGGRSIFASWWLAGALIAMLMASDYKFRVRTALDTLNGTPDVQIYLEVGTYALIGAFIVLRVRPTRRVSRIPAPLFLAAAYLVLLALSLVNTPYRSLGGVRVGEMTVLFGVCCLGYVDGSRAHFHRFAHAFLVMVSASVVSGLLIRMPRFHLQQHRFTWLRIHPVTAGVYVGLATIIACAYLANWSSARPGPRWSRPVYAGLGLCVLAGLLGTETRGAILGAVAGAAVVLWLVRRGRSRVELLSIVVLVAAAAVLVGWNFILTYLARGESTAQLSTLNSRTELWSIAWNTFTQKPMWGWGTGASRGVFLQATGLGGGHNAFVNVAVDLGLVGLVAWIALLATIGLRLARLRVATGTSASAPGAHGLGVDRSMLLSILVFLIVDGVFFEGLGATSNVASIMLFVVAAWTARLAKG